MEKIQYHKAKFSDIIQYSFGGLGSNIPFILVLSYLTYFYTDVVYLNAALVGILFLVSKFVNAVSSLLFGSLTDKTRTQWGRFRPWIMIGAPLLGLSFALLFCIPSNISSAAKTVYAFVTFIAYSFLSSAVNIPYHSLTPVMSDDPNQRTTIVTGKQMMSIPSNLLSMAATLPVVAALGGGQKGWIIFGVICAVIVIISFVLCAHGAKDYDIITEQKSAAKTKIKLRDQVQVVSKNRPLIILLISFGSDMIAGALANATNIYYFTYNLQRQDLVSVTALISTLCTIPTALAVPSLVRTFGKKRVMQLSYVFAIIPLFIMYAIPYSHPNGSVAMIVLSTCIYQISSTTEWAALADCVEYGEWKTGLRSEGSITSSFVFVNQFGNALGGMLTGLVLAAVGYVAGHQQTPLVLNAIEHMRVTAPIIAYAISIVAIFFYNIDDNLYAKITAELKVRRKQTVS